MYKKEITYKNVDGKKVTDTLYFNINKLEALEFNEKYENNLLEKYQAVIDAKDNFGIYKIIKDMVVTAYGERSEDGKHFVKNATTAENFTYSLAYEALMESMLTDINVLLEFGNGLFPEQFGDKIAKKEPQLTVETPKVESTEAVISQEITKNLQLSKEEQRQALLAQLEGLDNE